jgi:hypothetical protein
MEWLIKNNFSLCFQVWQQQKGDHKYKVTAFAARASKPLLKTLACLA